MSPRPSIASRRMLDPVRAERGHQDRDRGGCPLRRARRAPGPRRSDPSIGQPIQHVLGHADAPHGMLAVCSKVSMTRRFPRRLASSSWAVTASVVNDDVAPDTVGASIRPASTPAATRPATADCRAAPGELAVVVRRAAEVGEALDLDPDVGELAEVRDQGGELGVLTRAGGVGVEVEVDRDRLVDVEVLVQPQRLLVRRRGVVAHRDVLVLHQTGPKLELPLDRTVVQPVVVALGHGLEAEVEVGLAPRRPGCR